MNILFWLQKKLRRVFSFFYTKKLSAKTEKTFSRAGEKNVSMSGPSFNVETSVVDLLGEVTKIRDDMLIKLSDLDKLIRDIGELKDDAEKAVRKSDRTESVIYYFIIIVVITIVGLSWGYFEFISSGTKNSDYIYELTEKVSKNENDLKILKVCLASNNWFNSKCLEN